MEYCGACAKCDTGYPTLCLNQTGRIMNNKPFTYKGEPTMAFANSAAFSEYTVVRQNQAVKIPDDISFEVASLLGCGVMTGVGAVFNRAKVERGSTCAIIGMGGIGLNALQACKAAGASVVIGIDALANKESFARQFGATHFINGAETDALEEVRKIVPRGVDYSFECVGFPKLTRQAIDMLAPGGTSVGVGTNPRDAVGTYDPNTLYLDKTIMGCRYGSSKPHRDIPLFIDMYRSGMLKFDELVSKTYPMEDIQQVFDDMKTGTIARGVLTISAP
jgi:S-(hydroxymethyl)glutathione dehydrogenase/alcohol dehydrogenase